MHARWGLALALVGCHVRQTVVTSTPGAAVNQPQAGAVARALPATIVVADDGKLQFVEPLRCATDVYIEVERTETVHSDPNLATVVVGIVVAAAGVVGLARGLAVGSGVSEGLGGAGLAVGLPFAIAPWLGNGDTDRTLPGERVRRGAGEEPCGTRPVAARSASLTSGRFRAFGAVSADGEFEISPFTFVDAFAPGDQPALDLTADLVSDQGIQEIAGVIDASELAKVRETFLAGAKIDGTVEPMRKVPRISTGAVQVSRVTVDATPNLRIVVPVTNDGPGDAYQLRGIVSSDNAELDGRIVYIGRLGKGGSVDAELTIPMSVAGDQELAGHVLDLEVQLVEAHGAAPEEPARFHGKVP